MMTQNLKKTLSDLGIARSLTGKWQAADRGLAGQGKICDYT